MNRPTTFVVVMLLLGAFGCGREDREREQREASHRADARARMFLHASRACQEGLAADRLALEAAEAGIRRMDNEIEVQTDMIARARRVPDNEDGVVSAERQLAEWQSRQAEHRANAAAVRPRIAAKEEECRRAVADHERARAELDRIRASIEE